MIGTRGTNEKENRSGIADVVCGRTSGCMVVAIVVQPAADANDIQRLLTEETSMKKRVVVAMLTLMVAAPAAAWSWPSWFNRLPMPTIVSDF